jgi:hypothetical protein
VPYTTPSPGDTISVAYATANIRDQVVTPFATAAARTSAVTAPVTGMLSYRTDGNAFEGYDGAGWVPIPYTIIKSKAADEIVNTNATFQNDDDLACSIAANGVYLLELEFGYFSGTTPDLKTTFTGPAGMGGTLTAWSTSDASASANSLSPTSTIVFDGTGAEEIGRIYGRITTGATAGTLQWQWAQNASNASNTAIRPGSWMRLSRIS